VNRLDADIVIIGGGIAGTAIARALGRYKSHTVIVEKEPDVSFGSSKASTAIIHPGVPVAGAPLKTETIRDGNLMFPKLCKELDVAFKKTGEFTLSKDEDELDVLKKIKRAGEENHVKGLEMIEKSEVLEKEPHVNKEVISALSASSAGIVNPFDITIAMMENARDNGVDILFSQEVLDIQIRPASFIVETSDYFIESRFIINAAGLFADKVAQMVGANDFSIEPHKGEEIILDKKAGYLISRPVFPVEPWVLAIPTVEGNIVLGTSYEKVANKEDLATTKRGIERIFNNARTLLPEMSEKDIIRSFAGLRAMNTRTTDYIIESSRSHSSFINVILGSPGITSSPAVAEKVVQILAKQGFELEQRSDFNSNRKGISKFSELSESEKAEELKRDSRYGHVVCRCETVTEGEIVEAIQRGARTLDGVKYRTRAGMGRCQGGFCSSRVIKILARELKIPVTEVKKRGGDSNILLYRTKELVKNGGGNEVPGT
jgi:glycerol-3-phosphate dehydrogenase